MLTPFPSQMDIQALSHLAALWKMEQRQAFMHGLDLLAIRAGVDQITFQWPYE
jgi:hypothetical protein